MSDRLTNPSTLRRRGDRLSGIRDSLQERRVQVRKRLDELSQQLQLADDVSQALDTLSRELFARTIDILEDKLSIALQEVLEQDLELRVDRSVKRGSAALQFSILNRGEEEDILRGQGGSVANVLSVGLRLFALTTLPSQSHRRFLLLDEQDAWLRPEIVPRFVRIVKEASRALGFQVLLVSHHDRNLFESEVDRVITLIPDEEGILVRTQDREPASEPGSSES